jgi:hypothetical protein
MACDKIGDEISKTSIFQGRTGSSRRAMKKPKFRAICDVFWAVTEKTS